jgi:hypothetical protein
LPPGWDVRGAWLQTQATEGREAVYSALRELKVHGYYRVERRRLPDGRFAMGTAVSDVPVQRWADEYAAGQASRDKTPPPTVLLDEDGQVVDDDVVDADPARIPPIAADSDPGTDVREAVDRLPGNRSADVRVPGALKESRRRSSDTTTKADELVEVVVQHLPTQLRASLSRPTLVVAAQGLLDRGWSTHQLADLAQRRAWTGAGAGAVVAWLRGLTTPEQIPQPLRPPCGDCGPQRLVDLPDGSVGRCPRCHPRARQQVA